MALARFEPEAPRWANDDDEFLATQLLNSNLDDQRDLRRCLKPIAGRLIPILRKIFGDAAVRDSVRESAAQALADYAREDPVLIADLVSRSSASQYQLLFPVLRDQSVIRTEAVPSLGIIAGTSPTGDLTELERLAVGRRRARAAIALVQLGESRAALSAFQYPSDPEARTQFIHEARERGLKPVDLVAVLNVASNVRERFTLLLALGEFQPAEFPKAERSRLKTSLLNWYAHDPSDAIHGASGWLLRTCGLSREAAAVDRTPLAYDSSGGRSWFVDAVGDERQTFVVCPPGDFLMGSWVTETDRDNDESIHRVTLSRTFAIGVHEVTREQYERYQRATGTVTKRSDADPRSPAVGVSWYQAVAYCRWLTRQSGLVESDQCYDDPAAQEKGPDGLPRIWPFHPERRGFRLPTEAEWEYACRAGTVTPFSFGSDRRLLSYYGWFQENAGRNPRGWGELTPNFFGFFDFHGNAVEWCHDGYTGYDPSPARDPLGDADSKYRVYRGGGV
jgi:eukaryotic-like serine/threonine-protein kinase